MDWMWPLLRPVVPWLLGIATCLVVFGAIRRPLARRLRLLKDGFHQSVAAEPTVLISNGKVIHHNLEKLDMSIEELNDILGEQGASGPHDTTAAMAHPDGIIGIVLHRRHGKRHRLHRRKRVRNG